MPYRSGTWCLDQDEVWILKKTLRALSRSICGVKFINKKSTKEQSREIGLNASDANHRSRWRFGVNAIYSKIRQIWPPPLLGDKTG